MVVACKVKKFLARRRSTCSSVDSELKDSDTGGADPDPDADAEPGAQPAAELGSTGLTRIFLDACKYGEVLEEGDDAPTDAHLPPPRAKGAEDDDAQSIRRFADLVGRDLSQQDLAASNRIAKINVNKWLRADDGRKDDDVVTTEPDAFDEAEEAEAEKLEEDGQHQEAPSPQTESSSRPFPTRGESVSKLSPGQIVNLLIEEFGSLSTSDTDKEQLLAEMDGAYFQDIAIIGMIHLTTHRLTFHASLLSTRPDLLPEIQVIKQGPVTYHRPGFHGIDRKRRVWLELSHDMLTTFPSGKEEDRIKPLRSMLLSAIKDVLPEDPNAPTFVRINVFEPQDFSGAFAEFDTEESAREWRRELIGALYMSRHRRAEFLTRQSEDERNGVRISVPLTRIETFASQKYMNIGTKLDVSMSFTPHRQSRAGEDSSSSSSEGEDDDNETSNLDAEVEDGDSASSGSSLEEPELYGHTIQLCVLQKPDVWSTLEDLIGQAKEREAQAAMKRRRRQPKVIVDFGALSFVERRLEPQKVEDAKEQAIRNALSLGQAEKIWYTRSRLSSGIEPTGYFVISQHFIGYWAKCFSLRDIKYRFPISKVVGAQSYFRYRIRLYGMKLDLREHHSKHFDFGSEELRDEVIRRIGVAVSHHVVSSSSSLVNPDPATPLSSIINSSPGKTHTPSRESSVDSRPASSTSVSTTPTSSTLATSASGASARDAARVLSPLSHTIDRATSRYIPRERLRAIPKVINLPAGTYMRLAPQHYVCLTIGSRGDVQPYIALALGLKAQGHTVTIVTHAEYKEWVEGWGVRHRTAGGDPGALMKLSVEHKMFSPQFFKESLGNFRSWLDELLVDAWEQCKDADILLESPSAMAGVHIAEALNIPYFRCFTMPWTKTAQFPHPFLSPPVDLASFNSSSYILFDNVFWSATSGQINRWRRNTLHIGNTDMGHMAQSKIPFIYNFSPSVVAKPLDWGDLNVISGYWFLDNPELGWEPHESLLEWMAKARKEGKPIVYIGFGSITVPNPPAVTKSIIKAVLKSDVRAIVSKGWSSRMSKTNEQEQEFPPECYPIDKVPHDWLFPQVDAALHHGGAGTTGASLRAGIPTLIKPWFGDQFFWASRVQRLGAGMKVGSLHSSELARALTRATTDRIMKERAASVGEKIRLENGVHDAIKAIYTYLDRATRERPEA